MQISPRYDGDPIVVLDGAPSAVGVPFLRQRRRLAKLLPELSDDQWQTASRCEGWRVQDVVAHLTGTDRFWTMSIAAGLRGDPTRVLAQFDPQATPAAMVDAARSASPADTLAGYLAASETFCAAVDGLDERGWNATAESPVGHVTMDAVIHHALWDSWVHERDVLLPLGLAPDEEADEVVASLRYAAALSPAFAVQSGAARAAALGVVAEQPAARFVVNIADDVRVSDGDAPEGALVLRGDAIHLLEMLSVRAPLREALPADQAWLLHGLRTVFQPG